MHVPDLDGVIVTPRGQPAAVRGEGHRPNKPQMPRQLEDLAAYLCVPHTNRLIFARRGQPIIRRKGERGDGEGMATQDALPAARRVVPELDVCVVGGSQVVTVRVKGQCLDRPNCGVVAAGGNHQPVGPKRHRLDNILVPFQSLEQLSIAGVP
eukprot:scaffold29537_cov125-Isochrysis_galbana.AAC.4